MNQPSPPEPPTPAEGDASPVAPEGVKHPPYYMPRQSPPPQYQPPQYQAPGQTPPRYQTPPQYQAPPQYQQPAMPGYTYPQPGAYEGPGQPPYPGGGYGYLPPGPGGLFDAALHPGELNRPLYGASIGQAITRFFKNYVNFQGRASRSEFWWMVLLFWGGFVVLAVLGSILFNSVGFSGRSNGVSSALGGVFVLAMLGTFLPWLAISWRRLHDANLAGPLYLLNLIPYAGSLVVLILLILPPKPEGRRFDPPQR